MQNPLRSRHLALVLAFALASQDAAAQSFFSFLTRNTGKQDNPAEVQKAAQAFAAQQEEWARPLLYRLYVDGEWGSVLHLQQLGLAAMEKQRMALARKAFDEAIHRVEAIYADDPSAAKARSVFNEESVKDFKGEPYERAMLYYYRGLLYLHEGDYQNARAAFLAADRHDTLSSAEPGRFTGDFGLMKYLAGWASHCDGDAVRGAQLIAEAQAADPKVAALARQPANSLVLVDSGPAPAKWGDGEYKHILKFKAGAGPDIAPSLRSATGQALEPATVVGDLVFQATTRGGREVDGIMAGKASFKDNAAAVGDVALATGAQAALLAGSSGNQDMANVGLAALFVGLIAKGVESATNPAADTRAWNSLPARLHALLAEDIARQPLSLDIDGQLYPLPLRASSGRCSFAWGRTSIAAGSPPDAAPAAHAGNESNRGDRNRAFRGMLTQELAPLVSP